MQGRCYHRPGGGCAAPEACNNGRVQHRRARRWVSSGLGLMGLAGVAGPLSGCATQRATSQALTVGGAAAVAVGASLASSTQCYDAALGQGGGAFTCASGGGRGARQAGTALALAGVGAAAAGYALEPKGPDVARRPGRAAPAAFTLSRLPRRDPDPAAFEPYRLPRRDPEPPPAEAEGAPAGEAAPAPAPEPCRPLGPRVEPAPPDAGRPCSTTP